MRIETFDTVNRYSNVTETVLLFGNNSLSIESNEAIFRAVHRYIHQTGGRTGLMVRASDSGSGDPGLILGRVGVFVSLSKRHLLPKSTGNTQE